MLKKERVHLIDSLHRYIIVENTKIEDVVEYSK